MEIKKTTTIGCGRWGTFIASYLGKMGFESILYGRKGSEKLKELREKGRNSYMKIENLALTSDLKEALDSDLIAISIDSQGLSPLIEEIASYGPEKKIFLLCMKGIDIKSEKRLSQIAEEGLSPTNEIAVWLGPGHVQEFVKGKPNCMVIDSNDDGLKRYLVENLTSPLIRFYYGTDLIGNEIGAAAKNVIGIASGMLDAYDMAGLKGALMSRGTMEVSRLISALGGNPRSAYGLCHLGDYEATVFSKHSRNRKFGEAFCKGEDFSGLAEGYYTVKALIGLSKKYDLDLPISLVVYNILYEALDPREGLKLLMERDIKPEFY